MPSSEVHDGVSWRAFVSVPGAKHVISDPRWLQAGCPSCDCRYWTISGDGYAYCDGCDRGFGFALYACPVSGPGLWRYTPLGRLIALPQGGQADEDRLLGSVGLSVADLTPARLLEVSGRPGEVRAIVYEPPGHEAPKGFPSVPATSCRRARYPSAGRYGTRYSFSAL
jgi:hypothetical protein